MILELSFVTKSRNSMTHNVAKMALGRCASLNCNSIVTFLVNEALIFQKKKHEV